MEAVTRSIIRERLFIFLTGDDGLVCDPGRRQDLCKQLIGTDREARQPTCDHTLRNLVAQGMANPLKSIAEVLMPRDPGDQRRPSFARRQ